MHLATHSLFCVLFSRATSLRGSAVSLYTQYPCGKARRVGRYVSPAARGKPAHNTQGARPGTYERQDVEDDDSHHQLPDDRELRLIELPRQVLARRTRRGAPSLQGGDKAKAAARHAAEANLAAHTTAVRNAEACTLPVASWRRLALVSRAPRLNEAEQRPARTSAAGCGAHSSHALARQLLRHGGADGAELCAWGPTARCVVLLPTPPACLRSRDTPRGQPGAMCVRAGDWQH